GYQLAHRFFVEDILSPWVSYTLNPDLHVTSIGNLIKSCLDLISDNKLLIVCPHKAHQFAENRCADGIRAWIAVSNICRNCDQRQQLIELLSTKESFVIVIQGNYKATCIRKLM